MAIGNPAVYADYSGGNNKEAGPFLLQENQCQDSRNVYANALGALIKRRGFATHSVIKTSADANALDGPAHSLAPANLTPNRYLLAVGKTPSASTDSIVSIGEGGVANVLKTGLAQGTRWEFVQGPVSGTEGPIYGVNGVDTPQYWSGATASTATGNWTAIDALGNPIAGDHPAKKCQYLVYHLDKFWASGDLTKPGRIYSTGVDSNGLPDPRVWDSDYTDDIEPADGEQITGIGKVGPYLLVFKGRKTYVLTDPVTRAYRPISSSIGCIAHRSIAETAQGTMFLSEDLGVCITDGSNVTKVSEPIQPFLQAILDSQIVNVKNAAATYFDDSYWLSLPEAGTNSITLQYDLATRAWWLHTCASNQFALLDPTGAPRLYSAQPAAQRIERAFAPNVYADAGSPYSSYWEGPFWAWGSPHINKRLHQLRADGRGFWQIALKESFNQPYSEPIDEDIWEEPTGSTEFYGSGSEDFGDSDTTIVFGAQQGLVQKRYATPVRGWGRAWSVRISDGSLGGNDAMELYAITAFVRTRTD